MGRVWSFLRREPLAHFAAAALALFTLYGLVAPPEQEPIRVTAQMARDLVAERRELLGRPLTPEERRGVLESFVDEEVLVREAMARDFVRHDSKIRGRLVGKMVFLLDDEPPEPSAEALEAFYRARRKRIRSQPSRSDITRAPPAHASPPDPDQLGADSVPGVFCYSLS